MNVIDHFSKFLWSFPLKNKSGALVAFNLQRLFMVDGSPSILASDNGVEFRNSEMTELCERFNVEQRHGQPYASNSQGAVERVNSTIRSSIFNYLQEKNTKAWADHLDHFAYTYNTAVHNSTKFTPFVVHRGRQQLTKLDAIVAKNLAIVAKRWWLA